MGPSSRTGNFRGHAKVVRRVKPPRGLLFAGLGFVLVCLLLSLWLYLKGFRVAYTEVYKEGPRFYLALTPIWDGYENRVTLIKDIITFRHNGVTLKRSEDGDICISYFPLPYYRALSIMYGDEYLEKFSHHFVCLGKRKNIDSLLLDEKITFSLEEANTYFLPVSFEGIRICGKTRCLWVYRLDRPKGKEFLPKVAVIKYALKAFLENPLEKPGEVQDQAQQESLWEKVRRETRENSVSSILKGEIPIESGTVVSGSAEFVPTGMIILYDGKIGVFDKRLDLEQLIEEGAVESTDLSWIYATPFRVCGIPFNFIRGFTSYEKTESQVLYIQFSNTKDCENLSVTR